MNLQTYNPEPQKIFKPVTLTDTVTGEAMTAQVETEASLRSRLAWSRTAMGAAYMNYVTAKIAKATRCTDLQIVSRCQQCGEARMVETFTRVDGTHLELCGACRRSA